MHLFKSFCRYFYIVILLIHHFRIPSDLKYLTLLAMVVNCENLYMGNPIAILIADDNKLMRQTLKLIIAGIYGAKLVGEATNGEEAIALAKEYVPDIILMDINMTPINGFEATRKILKENPSIKIIGLSLHSQPSYAKNMLQLGAKGYISKEANHNEIIEAIQKVAAGERYIARDIEEKL